MKKYAFYSLLLTSYFLLFILSCTKEYTNNPNPPTTTSSSTSSGGTSSGSTSSGSTTASTTAGTTTAGTTTAGTTTAGTTTAGTTTAGTTTAGTTTSGTTTSAPCTPPDNSFTLTNGAGSGNFTSVIGTAVSGYYGISGNLSSNPFMSFSFLGMDPPVAGEYDVVSALPTVGSEVGVYLTLSATDMFNPFYSSSPQGKVYIDVSGSTITATACSVKMINMSTNDTTVLDGKMIKP